ncbi:MAG: T9SS type A sorting domain-containing protein [Flavobacteriales bacterium]
MRKSLLFFAAFFVCIAQAQNLNIGHSTLTFNDPTRSGGFGSGGGPGRQIQTEVYYPATAAGENTAVADGQWPVIVFGHGFAMNWDAYANIWNYLVPYGYIMAFPRTEGGLFPAPSHGDFGQDITLVAQKLSESSQNTNSIFYNKISDYSCAMGHSMGGGAAVLAASQSTIFDCYLGLAPAETNPSAISAAANLQLPSLILSGSNDGVTPPSQHHLPIFEAITHECKSFANLIGGGHCYFANANFNCDFGESTSSTGISLSRAEQQSIMFEQITSWLAYFLNRSCEAYQTFIDYPINSIELNSNCPAIQPAVAITQNGNTLSTSAQGVAYQWYLNGEPILGASNPTLAVPNNFSGVYQLLVTFEYGCQMSNNIANLTELTRSWRFIPNPAADFIELQTDNLSTGTYMLFNLQGQLVLSGNISVENTCIDVQSIQTGTYFLELNADKKLRFKVLIQH